MSGTFKTSSANSIAAPVEAAYELTSALARVSAIGTMFPTLRTVKSVPGSAAAMIPGTTRESEQDSNSASGL